MISLNDLSGLIFSMMRDSHTNGFLHGHDIVVEEKLFCGKSFVTKVLHLPL